MPQGVTMVNERDPFRVLRLESPNGKDDELLPPPDFLSKGEALKEQREE